MPRLSLPSAVAAAAAWACLPAFPHTEGEAQLKDVTVQGTREDLQGTADSASEGIVTSKQLRTRPVLRAGDVMESVPGLVATQHAGEGKANQYFLRGFNLDHGTDFATWVDGVPINFPTHGHGQGYTDLYFLIPELVDTIHYRKGPYYAEEGDFSAAGSARIRTVRKLERPFAVVEAGRYGYTRLLGAGSVPAAGGDLLLAAERSGDDGPWDVKQQLRKTNLVARLSRGTAADGWSVGLTHYQARWTSTDQVPQRAIDSGLVGRFGSLDPTNGGRTERTAASMDWAGKLAGAATRASAYAIRYRFDLFSDFTGYTRGCGAAPLPAACDGTVPLDQFEQVDRRGTWGLNISQARNFHVAGRDGAFTYGVDWRRDRIGEVGLYDTLARTRLATVRSDKVDLDAIGLWSQAELQVAPQWRAVAGLRWDRHAADVASTVAANSGSSTASITSPKLGVVHAPTERLDVYGNWGRGFHSNDARGTVIRVDPRDGVTPVAPANALVRAQGYEVGTRQRWTDRLTTTMALWTLKLGSELVFAGDAGTTEPSRPSRRTGIEFTANWRPAAGLEIDADGSLSRSRFTDPDPAGHHIPGALERVVSLGATWLSGPWTVGARLRHFGSHPLIEDDSIRGAGSTVVNLRTAYAFSPRVQLSLDIFNLFDRRLDDIQYAYGSRLPGEPPFVDGVTPATLHVHPSLPRTLRAGLRVTW